MSNDYNAYNSYGSRRLRRGEKLTERSEVSLWHGRQKVEWWTEDPGWVCPATASEWHYKAQPEDGIRAELQEEYGVPSSSRRIERQERIGLLEGALTSLGKKRAREVQCWADLYRALGAADVADDRAAWLRAVKRAADLEYDLTGDCDALGPLLDDGDDGGTAPAI